MRIILLFNTSILHIYKIKMYIQIVKSIYSIMELADSSVKIVCSVAGLFATVCTSCILTKKFTIVEKKKVFF